MTEEKQTKAPAVEQNAEKPQATQKPATQKPKAAPVAVKRIVIVRVRGIINVETGVTDTMNMLRVYKKNYCSVYPATASVIGMLQKCKDYITWGEVSEEVEKKLIAERGEEDGKNPGEKKKFFRLNSPKKGYAKKGIKTPFTMGGALGNRGDEINDLVLRML